MKFDEHYFGIYKWGLPVLSAILLIFSVAPINAWPLVFFAMVPIFLFTYITTKKCSIALGWALFACIHAGYLTHATLSGFRWLPETALFNFLMQLGGFVAVLIVVAVFCAYGYMLGVLKKTTHTTTSLVVVYSSAFLGYIFIESFFLWFYSGFNYGALFFSAQHVPYLIGLVDLGSPLFISVAVLVSNIFFWVSVLACMRIVSFRAYAVYVFICFVCALVPVSIQDEFSNSEHGGVTSIAIIQEASHDIDYTFGYVESGVFSFPALEKHLLEVSQTQTEVVVYPFAPWSGVISEEIDNSHFDREVITMSYDVFSVWLEKFVPKDVVFVAWYTSYSNGMYYNNIGFFKNGALISEYAKENLFPFFDYTPQWALAAGIVSLPYDATAGVGNLPFKYSGLRIGSLVCSEVGNENATKNSAQDANMLFSLGSETMFSHQIPGEYNALRAQLSAERYNMPVVRANKFGPSVVYDGNGKQIGRLSYEETGILYIDVDFYNQ